MALFLTLLPVALGHSQSRPSDEFLIHWKNTQRLFRHYQPEATQWQTFNFAKATFYGVKGDPAILPLTACLSCREGGYKTPTGQGRMGGHKPTILAGSKILDGPISDKQARWKWLNRYPDHKIACLSAQFKRLYGLCGEEGAVRRWVKGSKWRCKDAEIYYNDVEMMKKIYYGG
jgi:hypothetical protein